MQTDKEICIDWCPATGTITSLRKGNKAFLHADLRIALFTLRFRNATGVPVVVSSSNAETFVCETRHERDVTIHTLRFLSMAVSEYFPQTVDATVTMRRPSGDAMTYWRIAVHFQSSALLEYLEYVEFPGLILYDDLVGSGGDSSLFWPLNEGCLVEDVHERARHGFPYRPIEYPSGGWCGLYPWWRSSDSDRKAGHGTVLQRRDHGGGN